MKWHRLTHAIRRTSTALLTWKERTLTEWRAKLGRDGVVAGEVVGGAKILVEAAREVDGRAGQVAAGLAREQRVPL